MLHTPAHKQRPADFEDAGFMPLEPAPAKRAPKTHTVPNSASVQIVLGAGHHPMHCVVVRRDRAVLAVYPATWNSNRIPSMTELMRDFRWH